ncbi:MULTISPECIES: IS1/IS1595 family N-terminal zinc-binding domain-containing protein [unclassified Microcoleus]
MKCPECKSSHVNKNGHKKGKQNYLWRCLIRV